jgi:hypothetical protein
MFDDRNGWSGLGTEVNIYKGAVVTVITHLWLFPSIFSTNEFPTEIVCVILLLACLHRVCELWIEPLLRSTPAATAHSPLQK